MADLMTLPECAKHGQMSIQAAGTPEQAWCGVWYRCPHCTNTVLLPSEQLDSQRAPDSPGSTVDFYTRKNRWRVRGQKKTTHGTVDEFIEWYRKTYGVA